MNDSPVTDLLIQASIKTENRFMAFSDSIWKDNPDTVRITGAYIIFYQVRTIYHGTHVTGSVAQSSVESEYNAACATVMALARFMVIINDFLNKGPDIVPYEVPLVLLYSKFSMCMANNCKYTKHTRQISRRINFVRNG